MARPEFPDPVKLFVAILYQFEEVLNKIFEALETHWGKIDSEGQDHPFDVTNYYESEMGKALKRRIISFKPLARSEDLAQAKLTCNAIEQMFQSEKGGRLINIDIGYLDHNKIVLASAKRAGQKIYLGEGIYADMVARFSRGKYQPFEWTFFDFRDGRYDRELSQMRERYLHELRDLKKGISTSISESL